MALDRRRPIWWFRRRSAASRREKRMIKYSCTKSQGEDIFYATLIAESPQQAKEMAVEETNRKWSRNGWHPPRPERWGFLAEGGEPPPGRRFVPPRGVGPPAAR